MTRDEIINAVKRAGVVGAGGGGFPTHVKLSSKVDTVIANGSECEPLLATDKQLMRERPDLLIDGLQLAMQATGAVKGIIAVKGHYKDVVGPVKMALPSDNSISVFEMENYYPAGDEFLLVFDVTGRLIPEGGIPLNVGVVVDNVVTLMQVARACHGEAVTGRAVTVTGAVARPCVVTAPIGTPYADLISLAGGTTVADAVVIDGGPMMGKVVGDMNSGIAKTTSGILVLPRGHFVARMKTRTLSQELKLSRSACCQCFRCTDMCPRNLLGHAISPHMTMRTINYAKDEGAGHVTSSFLCSQCGVCEMVACDVMRLSPKRIYADLKQRLTSAGVKSPHNKTDFSSKEQYSERKFPVSALVRKVGLSEYDKKPANLPGAEPGRVRIGLAKHTGAPAEAVVRVGDSVKMGDLIGDIPEKKLGARYHASISGVVTGVRQNIVEITA